MLLPEQVPGASVLVIKDDGIDASELLELTLPVDLQCRRTDDKHREALTIPLCLIVCLHHRADGLQRIVSYNVVTGQIQVVWSINKDTT